MKRWTQSELEYIDSNLGKMPCHEIAEQLGRSTYAVRRKCYNTRRRYYHEWTMGDVRQLEELLKRYSIPQAAAIMKVSKNSASYIVKKFGIPLRIHIRWTPERIAHVEQLAERMSTRQIADRMNLSNDAIEYVLRKKIKSV